MTDAATRAAARETVPCDFCTQPAGAVCRTAGGRVTVVHTVRVHDYGVWLSRQGEVDGLVASNTSLSDELASVTLKAWRAGVERDNLSAQVTDLAARVFALDAERDTLLARIAELEKPPVTAQRTLFGACPRAGDTAQGVVTRWGKGAAVRIFATTTMATRPTDAGIVHVSWKPTLAGITDTWVASVTTNLKPGDVVEVWHEADAKVNKGTLPSFADAVARKNAFHDAVKRVRPDLLVANTLTGWLFDPKSGGDVERWAAVKADVLGVDCDGVRPTKLPYTSYDDESKRALKFLTDHPTYQWFAVPEFGCPRVPDDADGTARAAWHDKYAALWAASGKCLYVALYEYDSSPNYALTTPAELDGWRAHV